MLNERVILVGAFWWKDFQTMFMNSHGDAFETQRALEEKTLVHTLEHFASDADAKELSEMMFELWTGMLKWSS